MKKTSYCPLPFDTIYSDNKGKYNLCCWAQNTSKFNQKDIAPFEFFLSKEMDEIRNKMLAGEKVDLCSVCYRQEKLVGHSVRTRFLKERQPTKVEKINLRVRNFGNHCNFACVMCIPYNSTTRAKELKDIGYYSDSWGEYPGSSYSQYELFKNDMIKNADRIGRISITGGEPFVIPKFWKFLLEDMPEDKAKNINLWIETNLSTLSWQNYNFNDIVNRYKKVQLGVSCDHYGDKLSFIRYPINVKEFESNLITYKKWIEHITLTVQLLNVFDLKEIIEYYKKNFDTDVHTFSYVMEPTPIHNPKWNVLSVRNIKEDIKEKLMEKYNNFVEHDKNFFAELKLSSSDSTRKGVVDFLNALCVKRNMDWIKLWPEVYKEFK